MVTKIETVAKNAFTSSCVGLHFNEKDFLKKDNYTSKPFQINYPKESLLMLLDEKYVSEACSKIVGYQPQKFEQRHQTWSQIPFRILLIDHLERQLQKTIIEMKFFHFCY